MIRWPTHLITELAERRALIFIGAGISAGCEGNNGVRPPKWDNLLLKLSNHLDATDKTFTIDLVTKKEFLNAAEVIVGGMPSGDFDTEMRSILLTPRFRASNTYKIIQEIDAKLVITTNYDKIYENLCTAGDAADNYSVIKYYDNNLISELRTPNRIIIKAHGCITNPSNIVLSKSSYFKAKSENRNFYAALDSLFITNTLLFLGYSLNDPDITLILENANISAPSTNTHYCVMEDDIHPAIKKMMQLAYNIHVLTFPSGKYDVLEASLQELSQLVIMKRSSIIVE